MYEYCVRRLALRAAQGGSIACQVGAFPPLAVSARYSTWQLGVQHSMNGFTLVLAGDF